MVGDDVGNLIESTSRSSTDIHLKKKAAPRSTVWLNFTLVESRAICNHCKVASYSYISSTQGPFEEKINHDKYLVQDGTYFHIRCAAHVFNLIVKDGLKLIEKCITKIRESVKYVNWSEARKRHFTTSVNNTCIDEKKGLWLDVDTRWNSTYHMLDRALLYRDAFVDLSSSCSGYKYLPSEEEWERVEQVRDVLEPFSDITDLFSGSDYPTTNLYFENVWRIAKLLKELDQSDDLELKTMAKAMKEKIDKYWFNSEGQEYNSLFAFALVLYPRHKRQVLQHCYRRLYDTEREAISKFDEVLYKLGNLYEEYDLTEINSLHDALTPTTTTNKSTCSKTGNRKRKFDFADITIEKSSIMETTKNKLHLYLEEPQLQHDQGTSFDILSFWKENEIKNGKLSHLARDILTVPLTTVASESTFSIGGRVLNKWRSSLLPEHVEALITSRSWMFGYAVDEPENVGSKVDWTTK